MNRAPHFMLLACPGATRSLAFGLRWLVLIGSNAPALARARGRRLKATHYLMGGSLATVAGFGRAPARWSWAARDGRPGRRNTAPIQAAAQLYALRYPGGGHSLICLPDGRYWVVAAQGGAVLSQADKVFLSRDDALRAQASLLAQRPGLPEHDAGLVWDALLQAVEPGARLGVLPSRWAALPLALRVFLMCLGLSAIGPPAWNNLAPMLLSRNLAAPAEVSVAAPPPDPYQAMLQATATHSQAELPRLLRGVGKLPTQVQGWALRRARCDAGAAAWACSAAYVRAHPQATNNQLDSHLPAGWQVSFKPLEEATVSWVMTSSGPSLADLALPSARQVDTELASLLQRLRPAFASVSLAPALPLRTPSATVSQPLDAPSQGSLQIRRRLLRFHGPLRSVVLLPGPIVAVRWLRLSLDVQPQSRPSLTASVLVADLEGELYEHE